MSDKNKNKRGRPNNYYTYVQPYLPMIMEMCRTHTEQQIAEKLGVGYSTFKEYKKQFPDLGDAIKKGRQNLVAELRSSLIKKAHGYEYTETKETTERVKWPEEMYEALLQAGFSPKQIGESRLVKTEVHHKQMAPDVAAINLALKNYDKENWANDPQSLELRKKEIELRERQIEQNEW